MLRQFFLASLASLLVLSAGIDARAQETIRVRITNQLPATAQLSKGLEMWKSRMEQATKGRVKVETYHNSQLYKDAEAFPAVQSKSIEMALIVSAQFSAYDPIFGIFDLPGLFQSYDQAIKALNGPLGKVLTERMHKLGVHPLYWPQQGFVEIGTTKRALQSPADFKGLKLRTHSKELARMAQLLGASPTVIAAAEVSTALSRGTIDGLTASISSFHSRKWFEGAPNVTSSHFGLVALVIIFNKSLWDGLPADIRAVAVEASAAADQFSTESVIRDEQETIATLKKANVQVSQFTDKAREDFLKATAPMYDEYFKAAGPAGKELVAYVRSLK
jgi:tripartite ATP-independent transporter DctP family solute receptor